MIRRERAVLAVIDLQERLLAAFPEERREAVINRAALTIDVAKVLGIPTLVSEQYRKGLGPTVAPIRDRLGEAFAPIEKLAFSCGRSPEFRTAFEATGRKDVLITGVEAHVCVLQTTLDLIRDGYHVFVVTDAVTSRRDTDLNAALALMNKAGAVLGTAEIFAFQLLERAGTDEFKQISKLVK